MCAVRVSLPRYKAILIGVGLVAAAGMSPLSYADAPPSSSSSGFDESNSLDMEEMQQARGREGINLTNVQSIQNIDTSVDTTTFNVSGDVVTGNVNIQPGSLSSYSGVGVFNITTGNANAVSGAVGISVYIANPQ